MSIELYETIHQQALVRKNEDMISAMTVMADIYNGQLPPEYRKFFPKDQPPKIVNVVRNAWDNLATSAGRIPELHAEALDESAKEEREAGLRERIAQSYMDTAEPTSAQFMRQIAWWLIGTGRSVAMVRPNNKKGGPILSIRDPRTALPNMRQVGNIPVEIFDIIFESDVPETVAIEQGLATAGGATVASHQGSRYDRTVKIYEKIDRKNYTIVSSQGHSIVEEHGLDVCPAWVFQSFNPIEGTGISLFKDQVSLMVAMSQLISMKIAAAHKTVNPIYWVKGHVGSITLGAGVLNKLSSQGEIGVLDPPTLPQADRDIQMLMEFSSRLNKNPDAAQGAANSDGNYTSAKSLQQLSATIDTTVSTAWDSIGPGLEHLLGAMFQIDDKIYPNKEKRISTNIKGKKFRDVYTPSEDIDGKYAIKVEYGFGTGGYEGFLQNIQANQSGVRSKKRVIESMPGVDDVDQELRQIQLEGIQDAQMANIQSQAAQGTMDMVFVSELTKQLEKGKTVSEAIAKLTSKAKKQAADAAGSDVGAVTTPEEGGEAPPQEAPAPPGLDPAAVA